MAATTATIPTAPATIARIGTELLEEEEAVVVVVASSPSRLAVMEITEAVFEWCGGQ